MAASARQEPPLTVSNCFPFITIWDGARIVGLFRADAIDAVSIWKEANETLGTSVCTGGMVHHVAISHTALIEAIRTCRPAADAKGGAA